MQVFVLDVRRSDQIKNGAEILGNHTKIKVVKIKLRHHLKQLKWILCMEKEFLKLEKF